MTSDAEPSPAPTAADPAGAPTSVPRFVRFLLFALLLVVVLRHAWVNDDAYITFRTIDNFVHGGGLSWNVGERVQAYTHPLWMALFTVVYFVTRETFFTAIAVSVALTAAAVWLAAWRHARSAAHGALLLAGLLSSLGFVDYSTSGLENPLSHLLLGLFFLAYLDGERGPRAFLRLGLLSCLVTLNRMDLLLVVLPALAEALWSARSWRNGRAVLLGFAPLLVWELFSLVYYGFPFPNTAYAKLGTGLPTGEVLAQGFLYYVSSLDQDPMTLWLLVVGLLTPALLRRRRELAVAAGVLLYLLYLVRIGGDFMLGRFLSAPLYVVLLLVARVPLLPRSALGLVPAALVLAVGTLVQLPTLRADGTYPKQRERDGWQDPRGVADERAFYHDTNGLLAAVRSPRMPSKHRFAQDGLKARRQPQKVAIFYATGMSGFFAGRDKHVIDYYALTDPLLARLPALANGEWRIGHFTRHIPDGYLETLESGANALVDEKLHRYYDDLRLVVRGPLWSGARLGAMWRLNVGGDDALIDVARYREPRTRDVAFARLKMVDGGPAPATPEPVGSAPSATLVHFEPAITSPRLVLRVAGNDAYRVGFMKGGLENGAVTLDASGASGLVEHTVEVPRRARDDGYDTLRIVAVGGDGKGALGGITLLDAAK